MFIIERLFRLLASRDKPNDVHDVVEDVALASRIAAVIGAISLYFLAPAGLLALFIKPPLIVTIAPSLTVFATGAYVVFAVAKLYDKKRRKLNDK